MTQIQDILEKLDGTIERVVFYNPTSGWTVLRVAVEREPSLITVVGKLQKLSPGESVRFTGKWGVDPRHGKQFLAETCLPLSPSTAGGIEKFLGSGLIPGVGEVMARRIVKKFGLDSLEIIEKRAHRLVEIPGIGSKRAKAIQKALIEKKAVRDVMVFLETAGVSPAFAVRIYNRYGNDAIRVVKENPYRLAAEVGGIGFRSADRIAGHIGFAKDSPERAEAGVLYVLDETASEGHVHASREELLEKAVQLLDIFEPLLKQALERLLLMGRLRRPQDVGEDVVYLPRLDNAERTAAQRLLDMMAAPAVPLPFDAAEAIRRAEAEAGIALAEEQRRAFFELGRTRLMILTGGPGTGKTTALRGLVACLSSAGMKVALAAPTGRASRRMAESTGREASTIHRLLEYSPKSNTFERDHENPLDVDALVVDEVSMVDIELFAALLDALRPTARMLLVGDPDQLPSVGPGTVLADLLNLADATDAGLRAICLREVFRQARSSLIVTGAHDILAGHEPASGEKGTSADFFMIEREDPDECLALIKELISSRIPRSFGLDPIGDIQLLTPMHKGTIGASNLNKELQALLNPKANEGPQSKRFCVNDKVMQIRNNYDLEVFNGDIGRVSAVDPEDGNVEVVFPEKTARYPSTELDQLTLAYACTVHKSQGSEYPAVIIPMHTQHFVMLQRNLLYTAITRGKRLVVIVGSRRALRIAIRNNKQLARRSGLVARVLGKWK